MATSYLQRPSADRRVPRGREALSAHPPTPVDDTPMGSLERRAVAFMRVTGTMGRGVREGLGRPSTPVAAQRWSAGRLREGPRKRGAARVHPRHAFPAVGGTDAAAPPADWEGERGAATIGTATRGRGSLKLVFDSLTIARRLTDAGLGGRTAVIVGYFEFSGGGRGGRAQAVQVASEPHATLTGNLASVRRPPIPWRGAFARRDPPRSQAVSGFRDDRDFRQWAYAQPHDPADAPSQLRPQPTLERFSFARDHH